jgi:hypothetical protein
MLSMCKDVLLSHCVPDSLMQSKLVLRCHPGDPSDPSDPFGTAVLQCFFPSRLGVWLNALIVLGQNFYSTKHVTRCLG